MGHITKEQAIHIANEHISKDKRDYAIYDHLPKGCSIYNQPTEECWYIFCSFDSRGLVGLGPSRLICISKKTGLILYDGPSNSEG
jgi:hypothetical protein